MRHQKKRLKLNRRKDHARSVIRSLATSLILFEKIKTTPARARAATPVVEKLITTAKKEDKAHAIREINKIVLDTNASRKLIEELKVRYADRNSGFVRKTKVGFRDGDAATIIQLELV